MVEEEEVEERVEERRKGETRGGNTCGQSSELVVTVRAGVAGV